MKCMIKLILALAVTLPSVQVYARGRIQNEDVKSLSELTTAGGTVSSLINDSKIYVTGNGINSQLSTAITNGLLGGSGGSKNYLANGVVASNGAGAPNPGNGDFEKNATSGWSIAHSAIASNIPTSVGSAGVPLTSSVGLSAASGNLSIAIVSTNTIQKKYSLNYASSAASVAGDMLISDAFYIDNADQAKMLAMKFYYAVNSGAANINLSGTNSNSFSVWLYDVTNATWLQPQGVYNLIGSTPFTGTVQSSSNGIRYQIALINNAASAGAFSLYVDDFSVGPQSTSVAPAMSDWVQYTPTITGFGTVSSVAFYSRRVGDTLEVQGLFVPGTTTATQAQITIGYNGSNANVTIASGTKYGGGIIGHANLNAANGTYFTLDVISSPTLNYINLGAQTASSSSAVAANGSAVANSGNQVAMYFKVPIQGWSSNTVSSADTDTRVVAANYQNTTTAATTNGTWTNVIYPTIVADTHSAYNTSTGVYTIPVSGWYSVQAGITLIGTGVGGAAEGIRIVANTTAISANVPRQTTSTNANASYSVNVINYFAAGNTVTVQQYSDRTGTSINQAQAVPTFSINRVGGSAVVQAVESVNMSYIDTSGGSIGTSVANYTYGTKLRDTHSAYSGGVYTVPVSGMYRVSGTLVTNNITLATSSRYAITFAKNGVDQATSYIPGNGALAAYGLTISGSIPCAAGDTLSIRSVSSVATTASVSAGTNIISIERVGN